MKIQRVSIVGAAKTGKTWLKDALKDALTLRGFDVQVISNENPEASDPLDASPPQQTQWVTAETPAKSTLHVSQGWVISDSSPLMHAVDRHLVHQDQSLYEFALQHQRLIDITLVMGLDLPQMTDPVQNIDPAARVFVDSSLRQTLDRTGLPYKVIYGKGTQRLNNALLAMGLSGEDPVAGQVREQGQFAINQGRTVWQCNECSDPACEHKLFSSLIAQRSK